MSVIGFLGAGAMGQLMMTNLLAEGHDLFVWNRTASRCHALVEQGANQCITPREVAQQSDIVMAMVTDDEASRSVWFDPETGAALGLKKNAVAIECSTLSHAWCLELAASISKTGASFLDAPVVGSRPQATACQLIHFVGGDKKVLNDIEDILKVNAAAIHHTGDIGSGMMMKLAVNGIFSAQVNVLGEVLGVLNKAGVSNASAISLLNDLPVSSPALKGMGLLIAAENYEPLFPVDLVEKDLCYLQRLAQSVESDTPGIDVTRRNYQNAKAAGHGQDNIVGVAKVFQ